MQRISLSRNDLLRPVQAVSGAVERRHTLPILANLLLEIGEGSVGVTATDLEIQVTARCASASAEAIAATVSARKLQEILRALPEDTTVGIEAAENRFTLKSGRSRFNLQALPAKDFPKLSLADAAIAEFRLSQKDLKSLLQAVQYSMAHQDIRYYLNGLLLSLAEGKLVAVATDGHRLAYAEMAVNGEFSKSEIILPRKAVLEIVRLLGENDNEVLVTFRSSQVALRFGEIEFVTKVIDGKFPDFQKVIPVGYQKTIAVDRAQLLQSLQRAAILSNEKFRGIRWILTEDTLRIVSTNAEQEEAEEELPVDYRYDAIDVGCNVGYLLDVLMNTRSETVEFSLGDSNSSMLVTIPGDSSFKYVVMPMRI
jgi:DNA polymerase III subunit beta